MVVAFAQEEERAHEKAAHEAEQARKASLLEQSQDIERKRLALEQVPFHHTQLGPSLYQCITLLCECR